MKKRSPVFDMSWSSAEALAEALLALRSLSRLPLVTVLQTCSKASWLAVPLKEVRVLLRRLKNSKVSLACPVTCRLQVRQASTRLRALLTTHSLTAHSHKDLPTAMVLNRRNRRLHQVQVSRTLVVLLAALMALPRLNRANRIRIPAHLA